MCPVNMLDTEIVSAWFHSEIQSPLFRSNAIQIESRTLKDVIQCSHYTDLWDYLKHIQLPQARYMEILERRMSTWQCCLVYVVDPSL